jgi:hypothetical protein
VTTPKSKGVYETIIGHYNDMKFTKRVDKGERFLSVYGFYNDFGRLLTYVNAHPTLAEAERLIQNVKDDPNRKWALTVAIEARPAKTRKE